MTNYKAQYAEKKPQCLSPLGNAAKNTLGYLAHRPDPLFLYKQVRRRAVVKPAKIEQIVEE